MTLLPVSPIPLNRHSCRSRFAPGPPFELSRYNASQLPDGNECGAWGPGRGGHHRAGHRGVRSARRRGRGLHSSTFQLNLSRF